MTHCAKCSQPLYLTGPHACSITRGDAVPEVDLLRAEVIRLGEVERKGDELLRVAHLQVDELRAKLKDSEGDHRQIHGLQLQKDEVLEALRELVHGVEDNWNHVGRCQMGLHTEAPVDCECGRDVLLEEPLEILFRVRPSTEKPVCDCGVEANRSKAPHAINCALKRVEPSHNEAMESQDDD